MSSMGHYIVDNKQFSIKSAAVLEASSKNTGITWYFHNQIWENALTKIDKITASLDDLYRVRAYQLRQKYDYLILNYSGGPDSHNVLMSFLNNNIHIDEIYVQYSHSIDRKLYVPNTLNRNSENIHSEWDYCIKPVLDEIAVKFPKIKIVVHDIFDNVNFEKFQAESLFQSGFYTGAFELLRQSSCSPTIKALAGTNKKVAEIWGIDKPLILVKKKGLYCYFTDKAVGVAGDKLRHNSDNISTELFYWTPDLPEIVLKQCAIIYKYLLMNKELRASITSKWSDLKNHHLQEHIRGVLIKLIYTTWDNKFQVEKPQVFSNLGRTRDKFYFDRVEFSKYFEQYEYHLSDWLSSVTPENYFLDINQSRICSTPLLEIGIFND